MDQKKIYNQVLEDMARRILTYYGNIDTTSGAAVQYYVKRKLLKTLKDLKKGEQDGK